MKITLSQLEQYLSKAAWILKGPLDASDFKIYIFPLLFFKRISDVYPLNDQLKIASQLEFMEKQLEDFEYKISTSQSLQKCLINQVF